MPSFSTCFLRSSPWSCSSEVEHLRLDPFLPETHLWRGEVDCAERLDGAAIENAILPGFLRVAAEKRNLVTDQRGGEEGITVDPDLAIVRDVTHLHADLVSVTDDHHRDPLGIAWVGVHHDAGIATELVDAPALWHELFERWLQDAVAHRRLQADRARGSEDVAHELELALGHRARPGLGF